MHLDRAAQTRAGSGHDESRAKDRAWVHPVALVEYAMPRAQRRIAALAKGAGMFC